MVKQNLLSGAFDNIIHKHISLSHLLVISPCHKASPPTKLHTFALNSCTPAPAFLLSSLRTASILKASARFSVLLCWKLLWSALRYLGRVEGEQMPTDNSAWCALFSSYNRSDCKDSHHTRHFTKYIRLNRYIASANSCRGKPAITYGVGRVL